MDRLVLALVVGYLVGSVPVAVLVGRRHRGVDLRDVGDRNPGYWNARQHLGRRASLVVFAGDVAKGALAGAAGVWAAAGADGRAWPPFTAAGPDSRWWWMAWVAVGAAMVGHAWPVFARFRGGRSILAFVGGMVVVLPVPALVAVGVCVAVSLTFRSFAYGTRAGVFGLPVVQLLWSWADAERVAATVALMGIIGLRFAQAARAARSGGPATNAPGAGPPS